MLWKGLGMAGSLGDFGKGLIAIGLLLLVAGMCCLWAPKIPWLGQLPGDMVVRRETWTFYAPLGTCLLISMALSFIMWFLSRR